MSSFFEKKMRFLLTKQDSEGNTKKMHFFVFFPAALQPFRKLNIP